LAEIKKALNPREGIEDFIVKTGALRCDAFGQYLEQTICYCQ
jgi:hypothetical protein